MHTIVYNTEERLYIGSIGREITAENTLCTLYNVPTYIYCNIIWVGTTRSTNRHHVSCIFYTQRIVYIPACVVEIVFGLTRVRHHHHHHHHHCRCIARYIIIS